MMRRIDLAILISLLIVPLIPISFVSAEEGQGTPWLATPIGEAKENGKMTFQITVRHSWVPFKTETTDTLDVNVQKGWTEERKAQELETVLNNKFGDFLIVSRTNSIVKVQLKKGAKYHGVDLKDIAGVKGGEYKTGETGITIKDDPTSSVRLEMVAFDIEGTPIDPAGVAVLKIGSTYPLVSVSTHGKSPTIIKSELVYWFNDLYTGTGFVAEIDYAGRVAVSDVPCPEGVTSGANDSNLSWTLSMEDPSEVVGGIILPVDKFGLLAPHIGLASTILVAAVASTTYFKRVKRRKEKQ
jgi:hypothetical protein